MRLFRTTSIFSKRYFCAEGKDFFAHKVMSPLEFLTRLETRLEKNQEKHEKRLETIRLDLKEDQEKQEQRLKDFQKGNNSWLLLQMFGVVVTGVSVGLAGFNWLGFELNHSWRNENPKK
jgi:hypothetical protein